MYIPNILIVDDDSVNIELMSLLLEPNFNVKVAFNGEVALKIVEKHNIDLIITDIEMPLMNGIELVKEVKKINHNIEIIILSSYTDSKYLFELINEGVSKYILKPIKKDIFMEAILKCLELVKLKKENNYYNELINKHIISIKTDLDNYITYASDAFYEITSYNETQIIQKNNNIFELFNINDDIKNEIFKKVDLDEKWNGELKNKAKDGNNFWYQTTVSSIFIDGVKTGYSWIGHDITSKKLIEEFSYILENELEKKIEELALKENELKMQAKNAALGEMFNLIAHQWRQPLSLITSTMSKMKIQKEFNELNNENFNKNYEAILDNVRYMNNTIDEFRNFFKQKNFKSKIKLSELLNKTYTLMANSLKDYNIQFSINYENDIENLNINIDVSKINQVLMNLIKNSIDEFSKKNISNAFIEINCVTKEKNLFIKISDNAGGIPVDIINEIFKPYFSTKEGEKGTGLGLFMSKTIIEEHLKGKLNTYNNEKGGATFEIML